MRRIPELDAIRGLAALTIVCYHLRPSHLFFGWAAVDLFFVLSGYLITSIIVTHQSSEGFLRAFYARRALRIWPIYYLALALVVALTPFLPNAGGLTRALPYYLTYTQNVPFYWFGESPSSPLLVHTWSLAVEEHFYLLWPLFLCLAGRKAVLPLSAALVAAAFSARAAGFHLHILLTRCDGLVLGGILAHLLTRGDGTQRVPTALRIALVLIATVSLSYLVGGVLHFGHSPFLGTPDREDMPLYPALTLLSCNLLFASSIGLIVCYSGRPLVRLLRNRVLMYLGQISYGLYLYHWIVLKSLRPLGEHFGVNHTGGFDLTILLVSVGLASASWLFLERPILRLKDRFAYAHRLSLPSVPAVTSGATPRSRTRGLLRPELPRVEL